MITNQNYTTGDYFTAFRRRRGSLLAIAAPVIVITIALSLLLPDEFTSYSRIDIDLEGSNVQTLEPIELTRYADQYISRLKDRVLARHNLLALANDSEVFPGGQDELTESDRLDKIWRSIDVSVVTQPVLSPLRGRELQLISGLRVAYVDADPQVAFHVANHVAGLFLEADRLSRTERASSTSTFLRKQMKGVERDIVDLENEIAEFKVKNACCLPELMNLNMTIIQRAERDIENLQPRVRMLQKDRKFLQLQLDEIQPQGVSSDRLAELEQEYLRLVSTYGPDYPDLGRVRREISAITSARSGSGATVELIELRLQLAEAEQRYSSEHPDVIRYKREIAALEAQQESSGRGDQTNQLGDPRYLQLRAQINGIDTELIELQTRVPALRQKIGDYENRLSRTPQVESEYQAVNRQLQTAHENFENLQQRQVIARQTEALEATEIGARLTEVLAAWVPGLPSGPPRTAILMIGLFLAGTLGIGSMIFAEMTDRSVRGSRDIAMVIDMVPLATIPVIQNSLSHASDHRQVYLVSMTVIVTIAAIALLYMSNVF